MYHLSVYVHILAAITWIGGSLFIMMVVAPSLRHPTLAPHAKDIISITAQKFKKIGWHCLAALIVTGIINVSYKPGFSEMMNMKNPLNHVLMTKILLVVIIVILSVVHDYHIGKKAITAWEADPESADAIKLRKTARLLGRITLTLGLIVVLLAVFLTRGLPG